MNKESHGDMLRKIFENSRVKITLINGQRYLLANGTFVLDEINDTELRGWKILKSKHEDGGLWIQSPKLGDSKNNKALLTFFSRDSEINEIIKCKLIEAYEEEVLQHDAENMNF